LKDESIPLDWMNSMYALCPNAMTWTLPACEMPQLIFLKVQWLNEIIGWKFMLFGVNMLLLWNITLTSISSHKIIYSKFISSIRIHPNSMNGHPSIPWLLLARNFSMIRL
jgi:hypothetical protein